MENNCCGFSCPVEATIQLIGGKYKAVILWHLMNKTLRYNEIHKLIPKATDKMLAQQISNYIEREIFQQKLKAGQKLLSITNLSKELNVSKHTIQLSYKILRKKELIVKKGNDFFVTKDNCCIITKMKEETDLQIIKCLHELAEMGYSREQTKSLILRKLETLKFPQ